MIAKKHILELLKKDTLSFKGLGNLFSFVSKTFSIPLQEVKSDFHKLVDDGEIFEDKKGHFIVLPTKNYVKGKYIGNSKGFGFVDIGLDKEDVFVPANLSGGAIDGDEVIVKVLSESEESRDGKVVKIVKPIIYISGVVVKIGECLFLEPDNNHIPFKIKLNRKGQPCQEQDRVTAKIFRKENVFIGEVFEVLGKIDDIKACELAIIRDHQLFETFSNKVLNEVKVIPQDVQESQLKGRRDLRKEVIFTIDGLDAKDLDDAVSIKRIDGGYELGVHIADVGEYVRYDSAVDEEAYNRGTSVYFPTSVLPMLPKELSNGICSLNEGVDRLALSCVMKVNEEGIVTSHEIFESVIKSKARLNYTAVNNLFIGEACDEKTKSVADELHLMHELSLIIQEKNKRAGCLDFEIPEVQFVFDEKGMAVDFKGRERNDAHRLIEDFMVLANQTVAKEFCEKEIPFVYRVHDKPRMEKTLGVIEYLNGLNIKTPKVPENITPEYYQQLIALTENQPYAQTVNKVILRSMQKAKYVNACLGHFGLALKYYCHFTSPIRRYPDLTIHRIIKEVIRNCGKLSGQRKDELDQFTSEASNQSSLTEKNADKAEREVDDLWKAYLMKDRIGETFNGVVSSVTNFGVFVELENTVEGLIRIEDLPDNGFLFFEKQLKLKGHKMSIGVGDKVEVKLISANVYTRKIDFAFERFIK